MSIVQIRGLDEEVKAELQRQAKAEGRSLNSYLKRVLSDVAETFRSQKSEPRSQNLVELLNRTDTSDYDDLPLPPREIHPNPRIPDFSEDEDIW